MGIALFGILCVPYVWINGITLDDIYTVENLDQSSFWQEPSSSSARTGIVFGAAAWSTGPSDVFKDRLLVAADLYKKGRIDTILVSGDNSEKHYNEPQTGKNYLISVGVNTEDIVLDYAGFRSYDTCFRAKHVFEIKHALLITQRFHLPRSLFLCQKMGIEVDGVSASVQIYAGSLKNLVRESLAQQYSFYEVYMFPHNPRFLGEVLPIE